MRTAKGRALVSECHSESDRAERHDARPVLQPAVGELAAEAGAGFLASDMEPRPAPISTHISPEQTATDLQLREPVD